MNWLPDPEIPVWAREAGCPPPRKGETFRSYVKRLGLDFEELILELNGSTAEIANLRLAAALRSAHPQAFDDYLERRLQAANPQNEV